MTDECIAPLVPPDCNLRDFLFMPIEIPRLLGSEFNATPDDTAWRVGVTLWFQSWHQVPAASLPSDEGSLMRLADLGRDITTWRRIKDIALRGWLRADDGRLYHRVVAEKALEAWIEKLLQRKSSAAGNAKRWKIEFDPAPHDDAIALAIGKLGMLNPGSRTLAKRSVKTAFGIPAGIPDDTNNNSQRDDEALPPGQETDPGGNPRSPENDRKRQGQGQRQGNNNKNPPDPPAQRGDIDHSDQADPRNPRAKGTNPRAVAHHQANANRLQKQANVPKTIPSAIDLNGSAALFDEACQEVRHQIGDQAWASWYDDARLASADPWIITMSSKFRAEYAEAEHTSAWLHALGAHVRFTARAAGGGDG